MTITSFAQMTSDTSSDMIPLEAYLQIDGDGNRLVDNSLNIDYSDYWDILPNSISEDMSSPPYKFFMKKAHKAKATFRKVIYLNEGDSIDVNITSSSGQFIVFCFNKDNPSLFSDYLLFLGNPPYNVNSIKKEVPQSGHYMVVLIALERILCSLSINGVQFHELVMEKFIPLPFEHSVGVETHCFTWNSTGDTEAFLVRGNKVVAYSDNYVVESAIAWGTEARISSTSQLLPYSSLYVLPKGITTGFVLTDVYAGCEKPYETSGAVSSSGNSWAIFHGGFVNLNLNDFLVTYPWIPGNATVGGSGSYNCHAWAGGCWNDYIDVRTSYPEGLTTTSDLLCYDLYYDENGYTREGATESNSDIDIYASTQFGDTVVNHSTIRCYSNDISFGFGWESKNSGFERVMHPRYALAGGIYGQILAHYKKKPNAERNARSLEIVELSTGEKEYLRKKLEGIPNHTLLMFDNCYEDLKALYASSGLSTSTCIDGTPVCTKLENLIDETPNLIYYSFLKVAEREWLIGRIIQDKTFPSFYHVWLEMKKRLKREKPTSILSTNSLLAEYVKTLIKMEKQGALEYHSIGDFICDGKVPILFVSNNCGTISVQYRINKSSNVTLCVSNQYGENVAKLRNNVLMRDGLYEEVYSPQKPGLYIVKLIVDQIELSKKIIIK